MPIRPDNAARYPRDWALRSRFVRFMRARGRCEWCGAAHGEPHPITGSRVVLTTAHVYDDRPEASSLLNLAALWPQAPVTELSGTAVARPDGEAWRAEVRVTNAVPGPADQQRLPLQSLQADLEQRGARWTLSNLDAQLGGGRLQGQGWREPAASPLGDFQGELKASRMNKGRYPDECASKDGVLHGRSRYKLRDLDHVATGECVLAPAHQMLCAIRHATQQLSILPLQGRR